MSSELLHSSKSFALEMCDFMPSRTAYEYEYGLKTCHLE